MRKMRLLVDFWVVVANEKEGEVLETDGCAELSFLPSSLAIVDFSYGFALELCIEAVSGPLFVLS